MNYIWIGILFCAIVFCAIVYYRCKLKDIAQIKADKKWEKQHPSHPSLANWKDIYPDPHNIDWSRGHLVLFPNN